MLKKALNILTLYPTGKSWPWELNYNLTLSLLLLLPALIFLFLLPFSILMLMLIVFPVIALTHLFFYLKIYQSLQVLHGCKSAQNGQVFDILIKSYDAYQAGVMIVRSDVIIIIPIDGRRKKIFLNKVTIMTCSEMTTGWLLRHRYQVKINFPDRDPLRLYLISSDADMLVKLLPAEIIQAPGFDHQETVPRLQQ